VLLFPVAARRIITLTSDFGLRDGYVACMKGVILSISPAASIVDVSHTVSPQDVSEGAFLLASVHNYFPEGTIHLAVVDPGVGTARRPIAVQTSHAIFVGPDNGIFMSALAESGAVDLSTGRLGNARAVELADPEFRRLPTSQTFHGRDIFAPAVAFLASGVELARLGPDLDSLATLDLPRVRRRGGAIIGAVAHIDTFGNAITNISAREIPDRPVIRAGDAEIEGLSASYQDRLLAGIIGSSGFLEISVRNGNAAQYLGLRKGDTVEVRGAR